MQELVSAAGSRTDVYIDDRAAKTQLKIRTDRTPAVITIDCREVEHLKHEMAVFVSDWIGAIPSIKLHEFMLSPLRNERLEMDKTVKAVKEFFASIGETANYGVLAKDNLILIKSVHDAPTQKARPAESMFACSHCGYVTPYEVLWQNHIKIHYL